MKTNNTFYTETVHLNIVLKIRNTGGYETFLKGFNIFSHQKMQTKFI